MTMRAAVVMVCVAASAGVVAQSSQSSPQAPVFRGRTDAIRVDALVLDRNKPVAGLTADDFILLDNGVPQEIEVVTTAESVNVAIALDLSGSVEREGLDDLLGACQALVSALEPRDRAWLVTFAEQFALKLGPSRDQAEFRRALSAVRSGGGTAMWDAVFGSVSLVTGTPGRALVIALTDGLDTTSWLDEARSVEAFRRADVVVNIIRPYGAIAGLLPLEKIARATGGDVAYAARGGEKMAAQFVQLLNEFRLGYVLTYNARGTAPHKDGWHKVEVKLKHRKGHVRAREGYFAHQ